MLLPSSPTESSLQPQGTGTPMRMLRRRSQHAQTVLRFPHPSSRHCRTTQRCAHRRNCHAEPQEQAHEGAFPKASKSCVSSLAPLCFSPPGLVSLVLSSLLHWLMPTLWSPACYLQPAQLSLALDVALFPHESLFQPTILHTSNDQPSFSIIHFHLSLKF